MQIDRSNYEIWFLEWLDGNLNDPQVEQLKLFIGQNPDLGEELNNLTPLSLASQNVSFQYKEFLKKSAADISSAQFEYLCTAYLENDLNNDQKEELKEIISLFPDKKNTFELIQKTRLAPGKLCFRHKRLLRKRTNVQKVKWLSATALSAAAAISLIIILYSLLPGKTSLDPDPSSYYIGSESTPHSTSPESETKQIIRDVMPAAAEKKIADGFASLNSKKNVSTRPDPISSSSNESLIVKSDNQKITINKVPVSTLLDVRKENISNLIVSSGMPLNFPEVYDDRGRAGRFISKTFREKILKEKSPTDKPLKGFEIAGAGVAGLNNLFGWQMALDLKNDENGQPKSVYFTSKILKVNAPVKKREPKP